MTSDPGSPAPDVSVVGARGVQVGDDNVQYNVFLPAAAVTWPVRVGVVPPLADCYQVRTDVLEGGDRARVVTGMGGVGKSQLAAAYAHEQAGRVDLLAWIDANSRAAVVSSYAQAATELGHQPTSAADAARWFLAWLQNNTAKTWLVVLDDLADPADLRGLWPTGRGGGVVVTTRRTDAALFGKGRERIAVGPYTPAQARSYLAEKLGPAAQQDAVDGLVADLGALPLALAQATAFMLDRGETCAGYRRRLGDRRRRLAELFPADALSDDYRATAAATWSLSIEAADRLPPTGVSRPLLELLAVLDPNGVPVDVVRTQAAAAYLGAPMPTGHDAAYHLARFSLVALDGDSVRVHALVQRAATEHLDDDRRHHLIRAAGDALLQIWPPVERDPRLGATLRANALALACRSDVALWTPEAHPVLVRTGRSLVDRGLLDAAIDYWLTLVGRSQDVLGPDHAVTLQLRTELVRSGGRAGHPAGALAAVEALVGDCLRVLGPDHANTLFVRGLLAYRRADAGCSAGDTVSAFERLLADELRVLGPDHPQTLIARHDVARWRGAAGDLAGAVAAFEQLLAERTRVLGGDHNDTLVTRDELAVWRGRGGDAAGAVAVLEHLLPDQLRLYGPEHPFTMNTRLRLAYWLERAGDVRRAVATLEHLLDDQIGALGADHPSTMSTRDLLRELHRRRWR